MIEKSRNIPLTDLYSALQLEYISYFVRSKIYCKDFAENYAQVCLQKKNKIDNISQRNNLPSIFKNEETRNRYVLKFLGDSGLPNFTYKNSDIQKKMQRWDQFYYFCVGTSVSFISDGEILLGVIEANDKDSCIVKIVDECKKHHELHYNNIRRIFPAEFFIF